MEFRNIRARLRTYGMPPEVGDRAAGTLALAANWLSSWVWWMCYNSKNSSETKWNQVTACDCGLSCLQGLLRKKKKNFNCFLLFSSVAQLRLTLCHPMDCSTPGLPVHTNSWSLLKLMSIKSAMPYNHLILWCPLLLPPSIFPNIRVYSSESVLHIKWPKYWSFSFSISPPNEYSGLIFFSTDWFSSCSPKDSQTSSPTSQFTIDEKHQFFSTQPSL